MARDASLVSTDSNLPATADARQTEAPRLTATWFRVSKIRLQRKLYWAQLIAILLFLATFSILACLSYFSLIGSWRNQFFVGDDNHCYSNYDNRGIQGILALNVFIVQDLSFASAKAIDVAVSLVVGQGGRALHAWLCYHVFSDAVTRSMETSPVSYSFYMATKFTPISLESFFTYLKSVVRNSSARQRWLAFWFLIATAHTLAFPTLVGATTGYFSPLAPYYQLPNGLLISKQDLDVSLPSYVVVHCLDMKWPIANGTADATLVGTGDFRNFLYNNLPRAYQSGVGPISDCKIDTATQVCVQEAGYLWGMSQWMGIVFASLELIFACGLLGVWWDAHAAGELNRNDSRRTGPYRSALDIARAMTEDLGDEHTACSDEEIEKALKKDKVMLGVRSKVGDKWYQIAVSSKPLEKVDMRWGTVYG